MRPRFGTEVSDLLETKEPRKYPVGGGPSRDTDTFEIALPPGYDWTIASSCGCRLRLCKLSQQNRSDGKHAEYTRTFEVKELSVPLNKVEELKKLYRIIAGDERNTAVLSLRVTDSHLTDVIQTFPRGPDRPNSISAAHEKRHKTEREHRMAEARAEILPKGRVWPRVVR